MHFPLTFPDLTTQTWWVSHEIQSESRKNFAPATNGFLQKMPRNQGQTLGHFSQIIFPDFPWLSSKNIEIPWLSLSFQKVKIFPDFPWWWEPWPFLVNQQVIGEQKNDWIYSRPVPILAKWAPQNELRDHFVFAQRVRPDQTFTIYLVIWLNLCLFILKANPFEKKMQLDVGSEPHGYKTLHETKPHVAMTYCYNIFSRNHCVKLVNTL